MPYLPSSVNFLALFYAAKVLARMFCYYALMSDQNKKRKERILESPVMGDEQRRRKARIENVLAIYEVQQRIVKLKKVLHTDDIERIEGDYQIRVGFNERQERVLDKFVKWLSTTYTIDYDEIRGIMGTILVYGLTNVNWAIGRSDMYLEFGANPLNLHKYLIDHPNQSFNDFPDHLKELINSRISDFPYHIYLKAPITLEDIRNFLKEHEAEIALYSTEHKLPFLKKYPRKRPQEKLFRRLYELRVKKHTSLGAIYDIIATEFSVEEAEKYCLSLNDLDAAIRHLINTDKPTS
jgi:hypothetical protein